MIYIYGLVCPDAGVVRYIGKSINPDKRLIAHITAAVRKNYDHHTARWIRKLAKSGKRPELSILQVVQKGEDWRSIERAWIEVARRDGWPLTNTTAGGEGLDYLDSAEKQKYLANHREAMRRYRETPEGQEQLVRFLAGASRPETKTKRKAAALVAVSKDSYRKKMSEVSKAVAARDGMSERRSASFRSLWATDSFRSACLSGFSSDSCKAKQSERKKKSWSDPSTRVRMMNRWTPEAKAKQALELAQRQEKMKAAMTPEVRAKQAAKLRETWAKRKAAMNESHTSE